MDKIKDFIKAVYISVKDNGKDVLMGYPYTSATLFVLGFVAGAILF